MHSKIFTFSFNWHNNTFLYNFKRLTRFQYQKKTSLSPMYTISPLNLSTLNFLKNFEGSDCFSLNVFVQSIRDTARLKLKLMVESGCGN